MENDPMNNSHPWGQRNKIGLSEAFLQTVINIVTAPANFYGKISRDSEMGPALIYGIIISVFGAATGFLWQFIFSGFNLLDGGKEKALFGLAGMGIFQFTLLVIVIPIGAVVGIFLTAALVHFFLILTDWNTAPYGATVKVISYAQTASLANIIPFCGGLISAIWLLVLQVIGLKKMHRLTTGQSIMAALIPLLLALLCCLIPIIGLAILFAFGPRAAQFFESTASQGIAVLW